MFWRWDSAMKEKKKMNKKKKNGHQKWHVRKRHNGVGGGIIKKKTLQRFQKLPFSPSVHVMANRGRTWSVDATTWPNLLPESGVQIREAERAHVRTRTHARTHTHSVHTLRPRFCWPGPSLRMFYSREMQVKIQNTSHLNLYSICENLWNPLNDSIWIWFNEIMNSFHVYGLQFFFFFFTPSFKTQYYNFIRPSNIITLI